MNLIEIELYKISRNKWLMTCLAIPTVIVYFASIYFYYDNKLYFENPLSYPFNPYINYVNIIFKIFVYILPTLIAVISARYFEIDKGLRGKLLETLPISIIIIFRTKYLMLLLIIMLSISLSYLSTLISIKLFETFYQNMAFSLYDMRMALLVLFLKTMLVSCCIATVQYGLSNILNNYIIPTTLAAILSLVPMQLPEALSFYSSHGYLTDVANEFSLYSIEFSSFEILKMIYVPVIVLVANSSYKTLLDIYDAKKSN